MTGFHSRKPQPRRKQNRLIDRKLWVTRRCEIVVWVVVSALYFLRVIFLDADAAPWGVISYQPIDEGIYANLALNLVNFGSMNPNDYYQGGYEFLMQPHVINGLFTNVIAYCSLLVGGDTYFGLRMGSILIGYLVLVFFYLTLKEIVLRKSNRPKSTPFLILLFVVLLLTSFVFYNASRFVEPSLYRLFFVQIVLYVFMKKRMNERLRAFMVGFFVLFSIFFVYS